jgi:site-specific recombinase XerD
MPVTPEPVSLKLVEDFLTYCSARNLSVHTLRAYRSDLTQFVAFLGEDVALNRKLVRRFLVELHNAGLKPQSVRRKLAAVKSFCRWLEAEGFAEAGLIDFIAGRYRRDELPDVPSEGEVARLLDGNLSPRDRLILELLYGCGIRNSELVGINLDDFRGPDVLVVRGKGKKERFVIVGEYAQAALNAWLEDREKILRKIHAELRSLENVRLGPGDVPPKGMHTLKGPGRPKKPEEQKSYFRWGQRVENEIPAGLKQDTTTIGNARRLVARNSRMPYDTIVLYHQRFRKILKQRNSPLSPRDPIKTPWKTPALFFSVGPHRSAERLDVRSVRRIIKIAAETCGLDPKRWHPHLLRHAAATHMCDHGAALQSVSTLLGHAKLSTTQIYTRVSSGRLRRSYDAAHPHAKS